MEENHYKYIYGPVSSWRLGRSLGIDPVSALEKTCSFDCIYCQLGKTAILTAERKIFVSTQEVIAEVKKVRERDLNFITFAGNGEPTLAKNLGEMIREVKKLRPEKIAVITNASLIGRKDVQEDLRGADLVVAKLDADDAGSFKIINHPVSEINFQEMVESLKAFRRIFENRLALQIMFVRANSTLAEGIARLAAEIRPDEIEVNTPLRACKVNPLDPIELGAIAARFRERCPGIPVRNIYDHKRSLSAPFDPETTERRRGKEIR